MFIGILMRKEYLKGTYRPTNVPGLVVKCQSQLAHKGWNNDAKHHYNAIVHE